MLIHLVYFLPMPQLLALSHMGLYSFQLVTNAKNLDYSYFSEEFALRSVHLFI